MESRESWGAAAPKNAPEPWAPGGARGLVVHWVGSGAMGLHAKDHSACQAAMRGIQNYEQNHGYSDIAYNLAACPHGKIMEGRGVSVRGAANGGGTNGTYGSLCLLVGVGDPISPTFEHSIRSVQREFFPGSLLAHRQVNSTACPGDEITALVASIRNSNVTVQPIVTLQDAPNHEAGGLAGLYVALHNLSKTIGSGPILKQGATGQAVKDVQLALVGGFGQKITVDGAFGPKTTEAVKNAQRYFKIAADGIVGPQTRRVLAAVLATRFP